MSKNDNNLNKAGSFSRRKFLAASAASAAFSFSVVPSHVLAGSGKIAPSEKLNIAGVGCGGKGASDISSVASQNIVGLCDVDWGRASRTFKKHPNAPKFKDYRKMLDKLGDGVDALTISTPDHTHAVIAMEAMKRGKHVYVQKPLTHTISEARALTAAARKYKVATQMGNQGHATEGARLTNEWIADGAIGDVREVHCWSDRPIWPQDVNRPSGSMAVPGDLDWDLWVGPASMRPYNSAYAPFNWRGFYDFGCGALGDMAAHIIDHPFWALELGQPTSVQGTSSKRVNKGSQNETYPMASHVTYDFPARSSKPAVRLHWYDGGLKPAIPTYFESGRKLGSNGILFVGEKAAMIGGSHGATPRIVPEATMKEYKQPAKTMPRSPGHSQEWIEACKGGKPAMSNFDYAGPLTEVILLGCIAARMNTKLDWDSNAMKITNNDKANKFVNHQYRQGWSL